MRLLLDTHAFLWWVTEDSRLSDRALEAIANPHSTVHVSAVSAWEIAIKAALGSLHLLDDPRELLPSLISRHGFLELPITSRHALEVYGLPSVHRDPFDRLLVAQAKLENLTLVSRDPVMAAYSVPILW